MNSKKKTVILGLCVCLLCAAALSLGITAKNAEAAKAANVEYVNDDNSEILPHDGDVLVDSLKLTKISGDGSAGADGGTADENGVTSSAVSETVTSDDISELQNPDTYFEEVRATVNMDRNQIISMLSDVIADAESETEKENATAQKLKIIDYMDKEQLIEKLIDTKGLPACLVLISDNAVNVTVNKQDLAQSDVAKICDIVMRETGRDAGQIVIQSKF